jgi:hypothetical protein
VLKEKLDAAQSVSEGARGNLLAILEVEEILAQFILTDLIWGSAIVLGQLPHSTRVGFLGSFGQAAQLHVLDHALSQVGHD